MRNVTLARHQRRRRIENAILRLSTDNEKEQPLIEQNILIYIVIIIIITIMIVVMIFIV